MDWEKRSCLRRLAWLDSNIFECGKKYSSPLLSLTVVVVSFLQDRTVHKWLVIYTSLFKVKDLQDFS